MATLARWTICLLSWLYAVHAAAFEAPPLTPEETRAAAADYRQYCALCHGADRAGGAQDHAPSLRSRTLISTGFPEHLLFTVAYGRRGTPMAGFFEEIGGPMDNGEIYRLVRWLKEQTGFTSFDLPMDPVPGDAGRGAVVYAERCAACHGAGGEGVSAPAIGNPAFLALASDEFIRYTIEHGRDGTEMPAFAMDLPHGDIDAVTAFLRSRETRWEMAQPVLRPPPDADAYVLNPDRPPAEFRLQDGLYVRSVELNRALQDKRRLVVLDTRVMSMWQVAHIEGAVPLPYYERGFSGVIPHLPRDGTPIVAYCECPRAAAESVVRKLREQGFDNAAVLWEGIQGWIALGYPVFVGDLSMPDG